MCKLLNIPRATLYYAKNHDRVKSKNEDTKLVKMIQKIFKNSRNNYGTRKIKVELVKLNYTVSRRKMDQYLITQSSNLNYINQHVITIQLKMNSIETLIKRKE